MTSEEKCRTCNNTQCEEWRKIHEPTDLERLIKVEYYPGDSPGSLRVKASVELSQVHQISAGMMLKEGEYQREFHTQVTKNLLINRFLTIASDHREDRHE